MRRARFWGVPVLTLILLPAWAGAQGNPNPGGGPAIAFEASAVVASGLSPGKTVVWFGVERRVDAEYSADLFEGRGGAMSCRAGLALGLLGLALLAPAFPAAADVHPNTAGGFPVEQSFHVGDVDNVNLFNGSLTLSIPIGQGYPVNGGFSYSLKLVYNSSPWIFQTVHHIRPADQEDVTRTQGLPNPCSNAGLGWRVSLGRLDPPCQVPDSNDMIPGPIYQDEMGTDHLFYATLHAGDPEDVPVSGVQNVLYTRDGSYLRLKIYTTGVREVEFPDGTVRKFDSSGRPTEIRDAFGNWLRIDYQTANQWILTDLQNRSHKIIFRTDLPAYPQMIDHIDLAAFGGDKATYQFNYTPTAVGRSCPHNDWELDLGGLSDTVMVPLLTSVTLPDGSAFSTMAGDYLNLPPAAGQHCSEGSGNLTALKLPTQGRLEWSWQLYRFPSGSTGKMHLQANSGVATRTMRDGTGTALGTWTYVHSPDIPVLGTREMTTTVTDPLGHRIVNYFSTAVDISFTGWSTYDYSLPFTRNVTLNVASGVDLYLFRQTFAAGQATPLRSEYVLYERDPVSGASPPGAYNSNRRPVRSRTVYEDDGTYAGSLSSQFDGLGHYRRQDTEGIFPGSNVRMHFANFNPNRGTYAVNPGANTGTGFSVWPPGSPWVLETMSHTWDAENGATAWTDLCYAPGTATLVRQRVHRLDGAAQSANDLVTVYDLDTQTATGNVISERSYGGDVRGGIATGGIDLCTMSLPASPEYQINHTYAFGVRATSQFAGASFLSLNGTIDAATGLPVSSRDSAGLLTGFEYDVLGRLGWVKPDQDGWTQYAYSPAGPSSPASVTVRQRGNGSKTAPILAVSQIVFNDFGRVFQELRQLPDGNTSKRETQYDGAGNKASVSEVKTGAPASWTTFLSYDPFGRPTTIRPPDGAGHDVILAYHGVRQVDRTVQIGTALNVESPAITTEIYDRHGRLLSVTEPSGVNSSPVTTTYGYDVGNRLTSVATLAQSRAFVYDRAGLLTSETHPEKGAAGNGTVTYPSYDSHGQARQKIDGPNDLTFVYDAADRLTRINESATGRALKTLTYSTANGFNDWSNGKLQQASRTNDFVVNSTPLTVQVTETYTYGGIDGRVSRRDTAVSTGQSFIQSFSYNVLGLPDTLTYPVCTHAACTQPPAPIFTDVPLTHPQRLEIEAIYPGVTSGCGNGRYCPDAAITRAEMAVYLLLGKEGAGYIPPACVTPLFTDVPCSSPYAPWIQELYRRGITGGCNSSPLKFCPSNPVTNAQMSIFLLTSLGLGSVPACTAPPFSDVPCPAYWAASWVAELARRGIAAGCGSGNYCPDALTTRAGMAVFIARAFDFPLALDPNTSRTVQLVYNQGLLTQVASGGTVYGTITYHPNLLVSQIVHGNGVVETQGNDAKFMRRPSSEGASGPYASWSSGGYTYDGAGNVTKIGSSWYTYDKVSRLTSGTVFDGPMGGGAQKQQSYTFDPFGNLTSLGGTSGRATPTNGATNRLNGPGTVYDAAGNLVQWNGAATYKYDHFNQMTEMTSGNEHALYIYTADDERLWSYDLTRNVSHWTLRDLNGKVLRLYLDTGRWSLDKDYLYRDGLLLAAETQTGRRHYHLDHLGTPRLITKGSGYPAGYHVYYPFGEEATAFNQDIERMKFTGHERDLSSPAGAGDDLDYMHARHESPVTGRFLSVDPKSSALLKAPQTWNKYAYAANCPVKFIDTDGRELQLGSGSHANALAATQLMLPPALRSAVALGKNSHGQDIITVRNSNTNNTLFKNLQRVANSPGVVEMNLVPPSDKVRIKFPGGSVVSVEMQRVNRNGFTLPSEGTRVGNEPAFSPEKGKNQVYINSSRTQEVQAAVIGAELGAHALPALLGQGAAPSSDAEHHLREDPLAQAARTNAQQKP